MLPVALILFSTLADEPKVDHSVQRVLAEAKVLRDKHEKVFTSRATELQRSFTLIANYMGQQGGPSATLQEINALIANDPPAVKAICYHYGLKSGMTKDAAREVRSVLSVLLRNLPDHKWDDDYRVFAKAYTLKNFKNDEVADMFVPLVAYSSTIIATNDVLDFQYMMEMEMMLAELAKTNPSDSRLQKRVNTFRGSFQKSGLSFTTPVGSETATMGRAAVQQLLKKATPQEKESIIRIFKSKWYDPLSD